MAAPIETKNNIRIADQSSSNSSAVAAATYVDAEIATLEQRQPELETERDRLLQGQLTVEGLDGQTVQVDLSRFVEGLDGLSDEQLNSKLYQMLAATPVYTELVNAFRNREEFVSELALAGEITPQTRAKLNPRRVILANHQLNKEMSKFGAAAKFLNSNWLWFGIAIIALFFWGGGWFFYTISGGNIGGVYQNPSQSAQSSPTVAAIATTSAALLTPPSSTVTTNRSPSTPTPLASSNQEEAAKLVSYQASNGSYNIPALPTTSNDDNGSSPTPTITPTPSPSTTDSANRVGQPPSDVGGFNGPHGAFLAPSSLVVKEVDININVVIDRAIAQEQPIIITSTTTANTTTTVTSTPLAADVSVSMTWPRPGQVLHWGAFPGEIGNCLILGTQTNLADLRKLQQNDEIKLYDRAGNVFTYRVLAFSPTGQPERVIDLTNPQDNWVFASQQGNQAELTIIVSMPQPQSPINAQAEENSVQNQSQQAQATTNLAAARNDFATSKKLAYRAVLVSYAPKPTLSPSVAGASTALQIGVDSSVWQTQPIDLPISNQMQAAATTVRATTSQATTTTTTTTTATPTPNIPSGLPDTGWGGNSLIPTLTANANANANAERRCSPRLSLITSCPN